MKRGLCGAPEESRAAPGDPRPPRPSPGRQRTDKTRHFRAIRRHFFESVENSGDPGRQRTDKTRHFREAGRSVCERECRSWVAGPIIYGTSARPLSQFARGSAGPWSPAPLFTALRRGAGRGRQRHDKTGHFREMGRHFLDSVENSGGKSHDSSITHAQGRRAPWCF